MTRYRVDWHPNGYGNFLAVFDDTTGLSVAAAEPRERPELDELVRLANAAHERELADHVAALERFAGG